MQCKGCYFFDNKCRLNLPMPHNCPYYINVNPVIFFEKVLSNKSRSVVKESALKETELFDDEPDTLQPEEPTKAQLKKIREIRKKLKPSIFSSNYSK